MARGWHQLIDNRITILFIFNVAWFYLLSRLERQKIIVKKLLECEKFPFSYESLTVHLKHRILVPMSPCAVFLLAFLTFAGTARASELKDQKAKRTEAFKKSGNRTKT